MDGKIYVAGLAETPQMRKGGFSSQGNMKSAARVFKGVIARVCDSITVKTVNGYVVLIKGTLNNSRMVENGFCEEVCKSFMCGFPIQWKKLIDSNMEHIDEHSQSPSNSVDDVLVEQYLEKFMSDSFVSKGYSFAEYCFSSFGNLAFSDLGEPQTPECRGTSVNLGNENASEVPAAGMIPPSGSVRASEKNEAMALRSGRVLGGPISAPMTGGNKRKRSQHKASNNKKYQMKRSHPLQI